jgi:hypothetical protein
MEVRAFQVEIKRLNGRIAAARSELNKYEEQLADCERFRDFLNAITPEAHFEALRAERDRQRACAQRAWEEECQAVRNAKVEAAAAKEQAENDYATARTQQVRCFGNFRSRDSLDLPSLDLSDSD